MEGWIEGWVEGWFTGTVKSVLTVLDHRGIDLPHAARQRIRECREPETLYVWLGRAITVDEVLDGDVDRP
ncbi:hypothetical protein [Streptomyces sp. NPDC003717]|uniref:hypothetical protein n=1 Tax=Streptomyces sp. NPDC003717 TaxID=3154276 RepID=UPI0033B864DA